MSVMTYREAVLHALAEEMIRDKSVYAMAEDIWGNCGVMGQYRGLNDLVHDPSRILNAPISETAIVGSAVGAALSGMRPVIDIRFSNCMPVCMDEVMNQMAKSRYMFGGQSKAHLVLRCVDGPMQMQGAHHTDCLEAWYAHIPGIQVIIPSSPAVGKGLLKTAIRNDNPVIMFEERNLFAMTGEVPDDPDFTIPIGKAAVAREGSDVTAVVYGIMVSRALEAAETLEKEGISLEVIDLRSISPWDKETVLNSVRKTGRAVIAHEAVRQAGFGAEISATIAEEAFSSLKAPVERIGSPFIPFPATPHLEDLCRVLAKDIIAGARKTMGR